MRILADEFLAKIGFSSTYWLPLTFGGNIPASESVIDSWNSRSSCSIYIGMSIFEIKHLAEMRSRLGHNFQNMAHIN